MTFHTGAVGCFKFRSQLMFMQLHWWSRAHLPLCLFRGGYRCENYCFKCFGATMPSATSICIESDGQRLGPEPGPDLSGLLQTGSGDISTENIPLPIPSKDPVSKLLQLQQLKRGEAPTRTPPMPAGCLLCNSHMKEARLPACTSDCLALVCARCSLSLAEKGSRARCQTCAARVSP